MSEQPPVPTLNQRIADRARSAVGWVRNVSLAVKLVLVLGGAFVSAGAKLLPIETSPLDIKDLAEGAGVVAAFGGGIALLFLDKSLAGSLTDAADAAAELQRVVAATARLARRFEEAEARDVRASALRAVSEKLRGSVERLLWLPPTDEAVIMTELLDVALANLQSAMGLGADDRWTVSIYRAESGPVLRRIASRRAERLDEKAFSREWLPGEGHIGMTFLRKEAVVLQDVADPAISQALNNPPSKTSVEDATRYRSIASAPIITAGAREPWGVVIATSATAGRFSPISPSEGWDRAGAMRVFAGMLALAVSAHHVNPRLAEASAKPQASG